jgi:hypothetical protein
MLTIGAMMVGFGLGVYCGILIEKIFIELEKRCAKEK